MEHYKMDLNELQFALQSQKDFLNNITNKIYVLHVYENLDEACNLKNEKSFKLKLKKMFKDINTILQKQTLKFIDGSKTIKTDL